VAHRQPSLKISRKSVANGQTNVSPLDVDARYDMTYFFLTVLCANVVGSTSGEGFLLCVHVVGCVVLILDAAADFGETKAPFTRYNLLSIRL